MFQVTRESDHRITLRISGTIDAGQMTSGLDDLIALSNGLTKGEMMYVITDFAFPAWDALAQEFKRIPQLWGLLARFGKVALICDQAWIRTAAEIEGAVLPGLRIKSFGPDEADAAEAWLADPNA